MATLTPTEFHAMVLDYMRMVEATTRRLALEEAAKACESMPLMISGGEPGAYWKRTPSIADCAAACRALAAKEPVL